MTVGFLQVGPSGTVHARLARQLVASVKRVMPDVPIVQFTMLESAFVPGVNAVAMRPTQPLALACLEAYASVDGNWLFLDSDTTVQRDVRDVFDRPFDIAVATRDGTLLEKEVGTKFMASMPFNKGAVFSRSQAFWKATVESLLPRPEHKHEFMGDQRAFNDVISGGLFHVETLSNAYNYPPKSQHEDVREKAIVHWKGPRKNWGLGRAA